MSFANLRLAPCLRGTVPALALTLLLATLAACSGGDASSDKDKDGGADASDASTGDSSGGTDGPSDVVVETCPSAPAPKAAPGDAICEVQKGQGAGTLIVADVLLPGKVIRGGGVLLDGKGEITCVGCECAAQAGDATQVLCPDAVVTPGLIDAHNHIGWLNGRPWVAAEHQVDPALRWEHRHDWRQGKNGNPKVKVDGGGAGQDDKVWGELRYVLTGGTGMFGSGDLSGLMRDLDATGSGDHGLGIPKPDYDTFPLGDSSGTQKASGCDYKSRGAPPKQGSYVPHVAEGINAFARNEFLCMSGQADGGKETLVAQSSVIHGVGLRAVDYAWMASKGVGLIWSPRSNVSLYGETARVVVAARLGVGIGLGGDWVPSGSMNMLRELQCAAFLDEQRFGGFFGPARLWEMATLGSARALGLDGRVGLLAPGHVGDLAIFAKRGHQGHDAIVKAKPGDAVLVMRGGEVLAGHETLTAALGKDCEALGDVCGTPMQVCTKNATGKSFAEVKSAVESKAYPLFFCGEPKDEPTCLPARALEKDSIEGSTVYAGTSDPADRDGDGLANDADLCPDVFSPIRPIDEGKQADSDSDGLGDDCDPCPLDADTTDCKTFDPADSDGDGVPGTGDNCPAVGNPDQKDTDKDGRGDACDPCPDAPNPGSMGCPVTIAQVKTDKSLLETRVAVLGVIVTASAKDGFFVQDPAAPEGQAAGLFVYTGSGSRPVRGDIVDIKGADAVDFYGQIELTGPSFVTTGKAEAGKPAPRLLSKAEVAKMTGTDKGASIFEGQLVEVRDAEVLDDAPAGGTGDTKAENELALSDGLRLDDAMWEATGFLAPKPTKGATIPVIVGVVAFRNGLIKLLPRVQADVDLGPPLVQSLTPATAWQREGVAGVGLAVPVTVTLSHASKTDLTVEVVSEDPTIAKPIGPFVVAAGQTWIGIGVDGLKAGTTKFRAKVAGQTSDVSCDVRVLAANEIPAVAAISPAEAKVPVGGDAKLDVLLSFPAPTLGLEATVTTSGGELDAPATVSFAANGLTASFSIKAGSKAGTMTITVATSAGKASATLNVVEASSLQTDVSGYKLIQTASAKTFVLPKGTVLGAGTTLIVGRNSDKAAFEAFWKVTLPPGTIYINSKDSFPSINGDETFTMQDGAGKVVDGPTVAMGKPAVSNFQRKQPIGAANVAASWTVGAAGPGVSKPGTGCAVGGDGVFISEFSDAIGTGAFAYEFVEICFAGPKL